MAWCCSAVGGPGYVEPPFVRRRARDPNLAPTLVAAFFKRLRRVRKVRHPRDGLGLWSGWALFGRRPGRDVPQAGILRTGPEADTGFGRLTKDAEDGVMGRQRPMPSTVRQPLVSIAAKSVVGLLLATAALIIYLAARAVDAGPASLVTAIGMLGAGIAAVSILGLLLVLLGYLAWRLR